MRIVCQKNQLLFIKNNCHTSIDVLNDLDSERLTSRLSFSKFSESERKCIHVCCEMLSDVKKGKPLHAGQETAIVQIPALKKAVEQIKLSTFNNWPKEGF